MNRTTLSLITAVTLTISTTSYGTTIPDTVDINLQRSNSALANQWQDNKEVKNFTHLGHITILEKSSDQDVCLICHKEVEDRTAIMDNDRKAKQQEAVTLAGSVKKYMHGQCVACHKSMNKDAKATGPTSCKGCH
ncbi:MAG: cytochrome c3 family protein [Spirochaetales bacterium]|nr:cytochrome c3 family protein [Spirochaetales bacterium]